ncbi:hypothetical protein HK102_009129, partial [Quaeritorhiza haematococci]
MSDFVVEPAPPFYFVFSTPLTDAAIGVIIRIAADVLITTALILTSLLAWTNLKPFPTSVMGVLDAIQFQFKSGQAGLVAATRTALRTDNSAPLVKKKKKKNASSSTLNSATAIVSSGGQVQPSPSYRITLIFLVAFKVLTLVVTGKLISVPACELAEGVSANVTSGIVVLGGEAIAGSLQDPVAYLAQVSFPSYSTRFGGTLNDALCMGIGSVCESKDLCQYRTLCAKFDTTCTARPVAIINSTSGIATLALNQTLISPFLAQNLPPPTYKSNGPRKYSSSSSSSVVFDANDLAVVYHTGGRGGRGYDLWELDVNQTWVKATPFADVGKPDFSEFTFGAVKRRGFENAIYLAARVVSVDITTNTQDPAKETNKNYTVGGSAPQRMMDVFFATENVFNFPHGGVGDDGGRLYETLWQMAKRNNPSLEARINALVHRCDVTAHLFETDVRAHPILAG